MEKNEFSVIAGCGCDVYQNEYLFMWDGKTLCPDCMRDILADLPLNELVKLAGGCAEKVERKRTMLWTR